MGSYYTMLIEKYKEIYTISTISSVLYWDMNTYMPPSALEYRTKQFKWLQRALHKRWVSPDFERLIDKTEASLEALDPVQRRNVVLIRRTFDNSNALPLDLVGKLSSQSNKTLEVWKKAKSRNDFSLVQPELKKLFALELERADLLAKVKGISDPYEALIDTRDPGFTIKSLTDYFNSVKSFLVPFVQKQRSRVSPSDMTFLSRKVPRKTQEKLLNDLLAFFQYDRHAGRVDEVEHPLTIPCGPSDVRLTIKYHDTNVMRAVLAGSHECGHSLHAQQRNPEWTGLPVNGYGGPSFGESQSRLLENHIALSRDFWEYYYTKFLDFTGDIFNDISLDAFYSAINTPHPGPSRLGADELTYLLHIIIRFELEQELFTARIDIDDIPAIWNERYDKYLGVEVRSDSEGVLQDLHWFSQYWGYFHGYGMGDIMAAQIVQAGLSQSLPDWKASLREGNFTSIKDWLRNTIHSKGALYDGLDFIQKITGKNLAVKYYTNYLERKYRGLYE